MTRMYPTLTLRQVVEEYAVNGIAPVPVKLAFYPTNRCNLRCRMCWCWGDSGTKPGSRELSAEDVKVVIDRAECASPVIALSGGEPLVHRDIIEILRYGKSMGRHMGLLTNATLITPKMAKDLAESIGGLVVSLDGPEEIHDRIRGKGTFQKAIRGIELVQDAARVLGRIIPVRINTAISSINVMELDKMVDITAKVCRHLTFQHLMFLDSETVERHKLFLRDNLGIEDNVADGFLTELNLINPNVLVSKLHQARLKANLVGVKFGFFPVVRDKDWKQWYRGSEPIEGMKCPHCLGWLTVRADGEVTPCEFINYSYGNILEQELRDIWLGEKARTFRKLLAKGLFPGCMRCCKLIYSELLDEIEIRAGRR